MRFLLVLALWLAAPTAALARDYAAVDRYALACPRSAEGDVKSLAAYLGAASVGGDADKARAIFRWECDRIAYDVPSYNARQIPVQSPEAMLARRLGVCEGYARLYVAIASAAGLTVREIDGDGKGVNGRESHAWVAVKLDRQWRLLDPTWGAGACDGTRFHKRFSPYWFCTAPEEFVLSHFPERSADQMLAQPWSKSQFVTHANVMSAFFANNMGLANQVRAVIHAHQETSVSLYGPPDLNLTAELLRHGRKALLPCCQVVRKPTGYGRCLYRINARFPTADTYRLNVYAGPRSNSAMDLVIEYQVKVDRGMPVFNSYPLAYTAAFEHDAQAISPPDGVLFQGERQTFVLRAPGALDAMVENAGQRYEMHKTARGFEVSVVPRFGALEVYARFGSGPNYNGMFQYQVWRGR